MSAWYNKVTADISIIPNFIKYYENELKEAKKECLIHGSVEKSSRDLPGHVEHRFNQLQEIEAVLTYLNIELKKIRRKYFQQYLEHYQRALTSRDVEKYVDGEQEVVNYELLINEVALLRNYFLGIMKGLDTKGFQISNMTRLKVAGMEDFSV